MKNTEFTIGIGKANLYSFFLMLPLIIVYLLAFIFVWGKDKFNIVIEQEFYFLIIKAIIGTIFHELIHGFTWIILSKNGVTSIKFGINWKYLTPFCHCKKSIKVRFYRMGVAMPFILLGILPSSVALIIGDSVLYLWGLFFSCLATGDIIVLFMLSKFNGNDYVSDHPKKMGFKIDKRSL
ncbi:MAG: DUF3267 domain-containing protein [Bacteroidota bacterium]